MMITPSPGLPIDDFAQYVASVSNWGRWGPDDELGTINYITPAKIAAACQLARRGVITELAVPFDRDGPQEGAPRRFNPIHFMNALPRDDPRPGGGGIADDVLVIPLQSGTQWDSLAHVSYMGQLYNGRDADLVGVHGAPVNSIRAISSRIATRGVLLDFPRLFGVESLEAGYAISATDLDNALEAEATAISEGDALLVRTGHLTICRARHWDGYRDTTPGLGIDTAGWLHAHRVAAVATDTVAVEVKPSQYPDVFMPLHIAAIPHMGLLLGEVFDLDLLAERCATSGIYEFLFVAPPLPVTGAVGSPINPYAIQ
jgi:kynurenine formamidase